MLVYNQLLSLQMNHCVRLTSMTTIYFMGYHLASRSALVTIHMSVLQLRPLSGEQMDLLPGCHQS